MASAFERCLATLPEATRQRLARIASSGPDGPYFTPQEIADAAAALRESIARAKRAVQAAFEFSSGDRVMK
jgi:hypothetical protein